MRVRCGWPAAALVWGVCLLGVAGHALCYPRAHTVYDIYADASRNWWAGRDIYARGRDYYRYSPLLAIVLTPFAMLPDNVGNASWKLFNALIYMAGVYAWTRVIVPQRLDRAQAAGLWVRFGVGQIGRPWHSCRRWKQNSSRGKRRDDSGRCAGH